jgi:molybdopterin/thiamine biosynthesis adenylyltransferase
MPEPGSSPADAGEERAVRIRLRPSIEVFTAPSGEIYLLRPGERGDLIVRDPDECDRALIQILDVESESVAGLCGRVCAEPEVVRSKVAALRQVGALVEESAGAASLPAELQARFARQLPYFAETGDPAEMQLRLRAATVVIVGSGGLGTWAAGALASAGVGSFVLVDDDTVELSNLNRQILFTPSDIGTPKVACAARWLRRFDPSLQVRTAERRIRAAADLVPLLDGAAALVQAADWPPVAIVRWVDEACRATSVPYITAAQVPPVLKVGPTYVPGETCCFACHENAMRAGFRHYDAITTQRTADVRPATTLGPASGVVGTLLAMEVMHLVGGTRPVATEGRALLLDMRTLETRWDAVERRPDCPVCR